MYYSAIGAIAFLTLLFENHGIIFKSKEDVKPTEKAYRLLVRSMLFFYGVDIIWGITEHFKSITGEFIESQLYFFAMSICVLCWTNYAVTYLDERNTFATFLIRSGQIFCVMLSTMVVLNSFTTILFWIDDNAGYHATWMRSAMLIIQIILLNLVSLHTSMVMRKKTGPEKNRYRTIANYSFIVAVFIFIQLWFPLVPLCTVANMLGMSLLQAYVVSGEKEEYKLKLEAALMREKEQLNELKSAREAAYRDSLTGVNSKGSYVEIEIKKNEEIRGKTAKDFALAVFDLNG